MTDAERAQAIEAYKAVHEVKVVMHRKRRVVNVICKKKRGLAAAVARMQESK